VVPFQQLAAPEQQPEAAGQLPRGDEYQGALHALRLTRAEVARRFGVSRAAVTQALRKCGTS